MTGSESQLLECGDCGGALNALDRAGAIPCRCEGREPELQESAVTASQESPDKDAAASRSECYEPKFGHHEGDCDRCADCGNCRKGGPCHTASRVCVCQQSQFGDAEPGDMGDLMSRESRQKLWDSYGEDGPPNGHVVRRLLLTLNEKDAELQLTQEGMSELAGRQSPLPVHPRLLEAEMDALASQLLEVQQECIALRRCLSAYVFSDTMEHHEWKRIEAEARELIDR